MDIPASHADLLDRLLTAALTTHLATGRLQSTVVWYWRDGDGVRLSTMSEFVKARNLRARPRATLLVWDADGRWLELRADALELPLTPEQALAECDDVGFRYCGVRPYFGAVVPARWAQTEHPATFRLAPVAVTAGRWQGGAWDERPEGAPEEPRPPEGGPAAVADDEAPLPADHLDLLTGPSVPLLATADPAGRARVRPSPCGLVAGPASPRPAVLVDDEQARDLARDPRATLLVVDLASSARWMEVRADVAPVAGGDSGGRTVALVPRRVLLDAIHP